MDDFAFPVLESNGPVIRAGDLAHAAADALALARAEADQIRATARDEGHAEGWAAGMAQADQALAPARAALLQAASAINAAHEEFLLLAEARAVDLALAIAEKVIGASLEVRPELVVEVATGALRRAAERDHVVLLVNPDDLQLVRAEAETLSAAMGGIRRFEIVPERRVLRGGCQVQIAEGEIDAGVASQLEKAREVLTQGLREGADA